MAEAAVTIHYRIKRLSAPEASCQKGQEQSASQLFNRRITDKINDIQLVRGMARRKEDRLYRPNKQLKQQLTTAEKTINAYRTTIGTHASWACPISKTVKVL